MDRHAYEQMKRVEQDHWWFVARRQIIAAELSRLGLPPGAKILEAGCGTGGNLDMLRQFGDVCGIEPDAEARTYAASRSDGDVRDGFLPGGIPSFGHEFDLVAAFDVVEHVQDDFGAVAAMGRAVKPGGYVMITVPANKWMWSQHDERHHHKRRYTRSSLQRVARAVGLHIVRATYFNTLLFPAIAAVRLAKTTLHIKGSDDDAMPSPVMNRVLRGAFATERSILPLADLPFGVSLLLIAQRQEAILPFAMAA